MSNARKKTGQQPAISPGRPANRDSADHDPADQDQAQEQARRAEANGHKTATVTFRGFTFTIPLEYDEFPVDLIESLEEGKTVGIIRGALGPRQWAHVRNMQLRIKELTPLMEEITQAMGFTDAGESPASSD